MALDTDSQTTEPKGLALGWSRRLSLTARILAVNLFVVALLAGGLFFLDSYRKRLSEEAMRDASLQAELITQSLPLFNESERANYVMRFTKANESRVRLYAKNGEKFLDSFDLAPPTYEIKDFDQEPLDKKAAKLLDDIFDILVLAPTLETFEEPEVDDASSWSELSDFRSAQGQSMPNTEIRRAADATHIISAGVPSMNGSYTILTTKNVRKIRLFVRAERFKIAVFFMLVFGIAILLSLFLARTIVRPIKHLARAAVKVRLGRAQEVAVPRIPSRRDEIGMLARALADMSVALRERIDATEAFAADVAHEIKNPLASLRSALDGLDGIKDQKLRSQLMDIAKDDVKRMDRLISDISEASRVDAQLAKANFEPIDMGEMIEQLLNARDMLKRDPDIRIAYARPRKGVAVIMGEDMRIERVLTNLIDNAISFSPEGGLIEISATCADDMVIIRVLDEGPGVPANEREAIFRRFHSARPENEDFGQHSGLGLAIAKTIAVGHRGTISVLDREDGKQGACFEIALPSAESLSG